MNKEIIYKYKRKDATPEGFYEIENLPNNYRYNALGEVYSLSRKRLLKSVNDSLMSKGYNLRNNGRLVFWKKCDIKNFVREYLGLGITSFNKPELGYQPKEDETEDIVHSTYQRCAFGQNAKRKGSFNKKKALIKMFKNQKEDN